MLENFSKFTATIAVFISLLKIVTTSPLGSQITTDFHMNLFDEQSNPRLFKLRAMFEGNWRSAYHDMKQFGEYEVTTGYARCLFVTTMPQSTKYLYVEIADGVANFSNIVVL